MRCMPSGSGDREAIVLGAGLCGGEGEHAYTGYAPHIIRNVSAIYFSLRRSGIFFAETSAAMFLPKRLLPKRPDSAISETRFILFYKFYLRQFDLFPKNQNFDPSCFDPIQKFGMSTRGLTLIFDPVLSTYFRPPINPGEVGISLQDSIFSIIRYHGSSSSNKCHVYHQIGEVLTHTRGLQRK